MAKRTEPEETLAIWDQVVSESTKRLSTRTPKGDGRSKLSLVSKPTRRHLLTAAREPGKIDTVYRQAIRKASTDGIRWPLSLIGKPGTGKTYAGLCVVDHCPLGEWWAWDDFWRFVHDVNLGRLKEQIIPGARTDEGWYEPAREIHWSPRALWTWFAGLPLAVIDDVGLRGKANDTQYECFKTALDKRAGRPTIVTSNLTIKELGDVFDRRVMDRLSGGSVVGVELFGPEVKSMR